MEEKQSDYKPSFYSNADNFITNDQINSNKALDIIKKMKKEKAIKIIVAYRKYKFRRNLAKVI